jgi:hypothetical protein
VRSAHWRLTKLPRVSISTASPGSTSRSILKPSVSIATLSDATMYSMPSGVWLRPITSGRMPQGSRNASRP